MHVIENLIGFIVTLALLCIALANECHSKGPDYEILWGHCQKTFESQCIEAGGKPIVTVDTKECIK